MTAGRRDALIVAGVRTPFVPVGGALSRMSPRELGRIVLREVVERAEIDPREVDEVVVGTACPHPGTLDPARAIGLEAKLPAGVPAFTVSRDMASGFQAVVDAALRIRTGEAGLAVAVAVESMSAAPLLLPEETREIREEAERSGGLLARSSVLLRLRPRHLQPVSARSLEAPDPRTGMTRHQAAERLARRFGIGREEQDRFALRSHRLAAAAREEGVHAAEIVPVPIPPGYAAAASLDEGIRSDLVAEDLANSPALVDPEFGTVSAANSAFGADGAVAVMLASPEKAASLGLPSLGRLRSWAFGASDPATGGLAALSAATIALDRAGSPDLGRMPRIEIDEAHAVQVLACLKAFSSEKYCETHLGRAPMGAIDPDRVNVNGGCIAIGCPYGATGGRIVLSLIHEMGRNDLDLGLTMVSTGIGQGAALVLERS